MVNNLPANAGNREDMSLIPGMGKSPGGGNGNPLQCSCLENSMDREAPLSSLGLQRVGHNRASKHEPEVHFTLLLPFFKPNEYKSFEQNKLF